MPTVRGYCPKNIHLQQSPFSNNVGWQLAEPACAPACALVGGAICRPAYSQNSDSVQDGPAYNNFVEI